MAKKINDYETNESLMEIFEKVIDDLNRYFKINSRASIADINKIFSKHEVPGKYRPKLLELSDFKYL